MSVPYFFTIVTPLHTMSLPSQKGIHILHVDDEPDFADLTGTFLEREDDRFTVETATSADEGLERISDRTPDCVVSDYDMPGTDGIEFLKTVRREFPDLPFILFTGRGSEEVASDAISAGVTDYLQKESGTDQYEVLANRITNAVAKIRAEHELEEERQRSQILFERLTQPTVEVEYKNNEPIVQQVNPAFEDIFGYDASDIVGNSLDDYVVPEGKTEEASQINQRVQAGRGLNSVEVTRQTADGNREFLLQNAVYEDGSGGFAIYTDITDRKQREESLNALQEVARDLMNAQDKQAVAEQAVETARSVLDQPINGLWLQDSDEKVLQPAAMTAEATEVVGALPTYSGGESLSWEAFTANEIRIYDDVRSHPERINAETPIRSEIIIPLGEHGVMNMGATEPATFSEVDASLARVFGKTVEAALDRADREQQLRNQRSRLQRQNDRLDKFTSVVSHDLQNPLQVADGRIKLAQEECESPHLAEATDALARMEALIEDLLTVAREGTKVQETEPTTLGVVAEESWGCVETGDATLQSGTEHTIQADPSRLRQLFENLIRNAVVHGGEDVTVRTGELEDGFYVADDGPGIPAEERDKVFEVGYSTTVEGTGFGLNIIEEIVEAHGWEIRVTDSEDGGARFEITGVEIVE
jgi:PAS domain S-box-containing protein